MSGDLKNPSRAIPKGTLAGLILTFLAYTVVILALAATVTRESFYYNVNVVQDVSINSSWMESNAYSFIANRPAFLVFSYSWARLPLLYFLR